MEKLKFTKGIHTINIPFLITDYSSWQEQVKAQIKKMKSIYKVRKSARWGFSITENGAAIKCYKK